MVAVFLVVAELHTVEAWTGMQAHWTSLLEAITVIHMFFRDSIRLHVRQRWIFLFSSDCLNIFTQDFICRIVAICYFESHLANSTNIVTIVFFFGPASSRFFQPPNVKLFHFLTQKIKTRNTPTDFVTKEELWYLLDNFDRQIFHSSVGFAYSIRVRNEENNRVLAGFPTKSFPGPFL